MPVILRNADIVKIINDVKASTPLQYRGVHFKYQNSAKSPQDYMACGLQQNSDPSFNTYFTNTQLRINAQTHAQWQTSLPPAYETDLDPMTHALGTTLQLNNHSTAPNSQEAINLHKQLFQMAYHPDAANAAEIIVNAVMQKFKCYAAVPSDSPPIKI